jgi:hypothetical protein
MGPGFNKALGKMRADKSSRAGYEYLLAMKIHLFHLQSNNAPINSQFVTKRAQFCSF